MNTQTVEIDSGETLKIETTTIKVMHVRDDEVLLSIDTDQNIDTETRVQQHPIVDTYDADQIMKDWAAL